MLERSGPKTLVGWEVTTGVSPMGRGAEQEAPCSCSAWGHPLCGRLLHPRLLHTEPPVSWARLRAFSLPSLRTGPPHPRGVLCHPPPPDTCILFGAPQTNATPGCVPL